MEKGYSVKTGFSLGFSLIEIIVAIALLAVFITAAAPLLVSSVRGIMHGGKMSEDSYLAQQALEDAIAAHEYDESISLDIIFPGGEGEALRIEIDNAGVIRRGPFVYFGTIENEED